MTVRYNSSRRSFIGKSLLGGAIALGWPHRFSWAMEPDSGARGLKVVYFTDVHARVEWETPAALMMAAAEINKHKPELVLCGGDMITDGFTSGVETVAPRWGAYLAMHNAIQPRPVVALGNHDLVGIAPDDGSDELADSRADARQKLGLQSTFHSFDQNGYHIMILDSVSVTGDERLYRGFIDADQLAWIESDLSRVDRRTPIILVSHMPLVTGFFQLTAGIEAAVPENRGVVNNREVLGLFDRHHLLLVLQGHVHVNEMIRWNKTTFISGGAISGKWWRGAWHGTAEGYGVLELTKDQVNWSYHPYGWVARRPANV